MAIDASPIRATPEPIRSDSPPLPPPPPPAPLKLGTMTFMVNGAPVSYKVTVIGLTADGSPAALRRIAAATKSAAFEALEKAVKNHFNSRESVISGPISAIDREGISYTRGADTVREALSTENRDFDSNQTADSRFREFEDLILGRGDPRMEEAPETPRRASPRYMAAGVERRPRDGVGSAVPPTRPRHSRVEELGDTPLADFPVLPRGSAGSAASVTLLPPPPRGEAPQPSVPASSPGLRVHFTSGADVPNSDDEDNASIGGGILSPMESSAPAPIARGRFASFTQRTRSAFHTVGRALGTAAEATLGVTERLAGLRPDIASEPVEASEAPIPPPAPAPEEGRLDTALTILGSLLGMGAPEVSRRQPSTPAAPPSTTRVVVATSPVPHTGRTEEEVRAADRAREEHLRRRVDAARAAETARS